VIAARQRPKHRRQAIEHALAGELEQFVAVAGARHPERHCEPSVVVIGGHAAPDEQRALVVVVLALRPRQRFQLHPARVDGAGGAPGDRLAIARPVRRVLNRHHLAVWDDDALDDAFLAAIAGAHAQLPAELPD